jgi:hypothetical protein
MTAFGTVSRDARKVVRLGLVCVARRLVPSRRCRASGTPYLDRNRHHRWVAGVRGRPRSRLHRCRRRLTVAEVLHTVQETGEGWLWSSPSLVQRAASTKAFQPRHACGASVKCAPRALTSVEGQRSGRGQPRRQCREEFLSPAQRKGWNATSPSSDTAPVTFPPSRDMPRNWRRYV